MSPSQEPRQLIYDVCNYCFIPNIGAHLFQLLGYRWTGIRKRTIHHLKLLYQKGVHYAPDFYT